MEVDCWDETGARDEMVPVTGDGCWIEAGVGVELLLKTELGF